MDIKDIMAPIVADMREKSAEGEVRKLRGALESCAESLALAREKLGMFNEGDHKDRKADASDTIGSFAALAEARRVLEETR